MIRPRVHTIPPTRPFADALADGVLRQWGGDPLRLAAVTILLPSRRAVRAVRDAFLRASGGRPMLLPTLRPLGDVDADELSLSPDQADIPPEIAPLRRHALLTHLVLRWADARGEPATPDQAASLAAELARFLDEVQTEELDLARLDGLAPDDHARHWQITLDFLKILREHWPAMKAEEGGLDPAERRNRLLRAQADAWRRHPPPGPVIAAGSTGTIPAAAELLSVVARLPQGAVVLPGLDRELDDDAWAALDESHPQWSLARLLRRIEVAREQVTDWPGRADAGTPPARARLLAEAMRPAATSEVWRELPATLPPGVAADALDGVVRINCANPQEEATVIALRMRQALDQPGRTAALVTPDRALARRVAAALRRWGIDADDSGGTKLADTAVGAFLRLTARLVAERAAPVALLACLKHPLAAGGEPPAQFRATVRRIELAVLRGPRPAAGLPGLAQALEAAGQGDLAAWVRQLDDRTAAFAQALESRSSTLPDLLRAHVGLAEALAATDQKPGADRLWRREDGEAAAQFVTDLLAASHDFPPLAGDQYPALFESLMDGIVVRPAHGRHPRLFIWGLLEARLQRADVMILAGLNEGTWPPAAEGDPWLSRPMRKDFGLPAPEWRIGAAAHDLAQACGAPEVVLTRAERVDGAPSVPSRWLLRLDAVLTALDLADWLVGDGLWRDWAAALDRPDAVRPIDPPEPRPPVAARPRRLSVTEVRTWLRDPYAIYARRVLKLEPLDPIDADPGAADRGQIIHAALDRFVREHPDALPPDAEARLLAIGREVFQPLMNQPGVWAFWWPRFVAAARWVVSMERERRRSIRVLATEVGGRLTLPGPAGPFTLTGKADRIDRTSGGLAILDYKTGTAPSKKDVESGRAPQLPLEAAIAAAGGFSGVPAGTATELAYWRLGGNAGGEAIVVDANVPDLGDAAREGLERLIAVFDDPATPYHALPRGESSPYDAYAHLARVKEWQTEVGE